jgi:hypothetical protein
MVGYVAERISRREFNFAGHDTTLSKSNDQTTIRPSFACRRIKFRLNHFGAVKFHNFDFFYFRLGLSPNLPSRGFSVPKNFGKIAASS